jgi:hypothetical protein
MERKTLFVMSWKKSEIVGKSVRLVLLLKVQAETTSLSFCDGDTTGKQEEIHYS